MKHRQIGVSKVGIINADGHAIGLDIGATSVRAAILAPGTTDGRPSVTVHGIGRVDLAPGVVVNGVVTNQGALTAALKHLWATNRFECKHVILGIANQQVLVRDMQMPNLSPDQRAQALPFQAREIVALPMDQVVLDFAPLGEVDPATNMQPGLLLATPRQPVLAAVRAVEAAGLKVARVDLASFAALRSIAGNSPAVEAVIDIGAHLTTVVIHNRGVPKVVRILSRGGQELTDRVADRIGLSPEDAEVSKRSVGLDGEHAEVARVVTEGVRPLLSDIRSSLRYFASISDSARLERIALTGGGAALRGFASALSDQAGVSAHVVDPMQHVRNRWAQGEPETGVSAVSIGLAMGAAA